MLTAIDRRITVMVDHYSCWKSCCDDEHEISLAEGFLAVHFTAQDGVTGFERAYLESAHPEIYDLFEWPIAEIGLGPPLPGVIETVFRSECTTEQFMGLLPDCKLKRVIQSNRIPSS